VTAGSSADVSLEKRTRVALPLKPVVTSLDAYLQNAIERFAGVLAWTRLEDKGSLGFGKELGVSTERLELRRGEQ
jgi:hypothetical protein